MIKSVLNLKAFVSEFLINVVKHKKFPKARRVTPDKRLRNDLDAASYNQMSRNLRKENFSIPLTMNQRRLDFITQKWLEVRYGWTPLMHSIYDSVEQMHKEVKDTWVAVNGRSGVVKPFNEISGLGTSTNVREWRRGHINYRVQIGCYFSMPNSWNLNDFASLNPAIIAWELLPFSFVADWVLHVGSYLQAWENHNVLNPFFQGGYQTTSFKEYFYIDQFGATTVPFGYYPTGEFSGGKIEVVQVQGARRVLTQKDRVKLTSLPTPARLDVKCKLGAKQMLDTAALIHTNVVKGLRFK